MRQSIRATALLGIAMLLLARCALAQASPDVQAQTLFELANQERANRGLPALKWDQSLADAAQKHAERMAEADLVSHQIAGEPDLDARAVDAGAHFSLVAENVAQGPDLQSIHAGWMKSEPHRENLLNPQVDSVGIAVSESDGSLFAVQDFSKSVANLSFAEQEAQFGAVLSVRRMRLLANSRDAEKACAAGRADGVRRAPQEMVWFETTDLSRIPATLEHRIKAGHYKTAAVGACPSTSTPGFASYRIAVLLY